MRLVLRYNLLLYIGSVPTLILAITAYAYAPDRQRILKFGFDGYISKPFNLTVLKTKIADLLNSKVMLP